MSNLALGERPTASAPLIFASRGTARRADKKPSCSPTSTTNALSPDSRASCMAAFALSIAFPNCPVSA